MPEISQGLSQSAEEMQIGEIKELPEIVPAAAVHKSRQRAIPDFKPSAAARPVGSLPEVSVTRKSIHPNDIPREIHSIYGEGKKKTPRLSDGSKTLKTVQLARRRMSCRNLPFLTAERARRILKELKLRGRFLRISREMLEEQRKKYSTQSLKQKIDYLEAEITRISGKLDKLKENTKKNNISIKEGFSFIKQQNDSFQSQLNALEDDLQSLVYKKKNQPVVPVSSGQGKGLLAGMEGLNEEEVHKLLGNASSLNELLSTVGHRGGQPSFDRLLHLNSKSSILTADNLEDEGVVASLANHVKMNVLGPELHSIHNEFTNYHHKLSDLQAQTMTKGDVINMLKPSTESSQNLDSNHLKLMNLINKSVVSSQERLEKVFDEKLKKMVASSFLLGSMGDKDRGREGLVASEMVEGQLGDMREELSKFVGDSSLKMHRMEEDILFIKDQLHIADVARVEQLTEMARLEKARQLESEQLKILQKRIANLSVDKVSPPVSLVSCDSNPFPLPPALSLSLSFLGSCWTT